MSVQGRTTTRRSRWVLLLWYRYPAAWARRYITRVRRAPTAISTWSANISGDKGNKNLSNACWGLSGSSAQLADFQGFTTPLHCDVRGCCHYYDTNQSMTVVSRTHFSLIKLLLAQSAKVRRRRSQEPNVIIILRVTPCR